MVQEILLCIGSYFLHFSHNEENFLSNITDIKRVTFCYNIN